MCNLSLLLQAAFLTPWLSSEVVAVRTSSPEEGPC